MAHVRVGVRKIGMLPQRPEFAGCEVPEGDSFDGTTEVLQHWVEINGQRLDGEEIGLLAVEYLSEGGENEVVIRLASSSFATVDHRTPEGANG